MIINPYSSSVSQGTVVSLAHFYGGGSNVTQAAPDEANSGYWQMTGSGTSWGYHAGTSPPFSGVGCVDCGGSTAGKYASSSGFSNSDLDIGSGDFTIDFWIKYTALVNTLIVYRASPSYYPWTWVMAGAGGQVSFYMTSNGASYDMISNQAVHTAVTNTWYHYKATRRGSNVYLFVDGTLVATCNVGSAAVYAPAGYPIYLGQTITRHYISEFRMIKGYAEHTASFSRPTSKYLNNRQSQAPTGSQILTLLHFNGTNGSTTITESAPTPSLSWSATSPAVLTTSDKKFGTASLNPTGTNGKVSAAYNAAMALGTGDFTVSAWAYPTSTTQGFILDWRAAYGMVIQNAGGTWQFLGSNAAGTNYEVNISTTTDEFNATLNTWTHLMMTRRGNVVRAYVNGVWIGSRYYTGTWYSPGVAYLVGGYSSAYWFRGLVDEFCILKGCAEQATDGTFTPATAEY